MTEITRFERIMARVDAWADECAGWDCRDEAVFEVEFILNPPAWSSVCASELSDDEIVDSAIAAWEAAE